MRLGTINDDAEQKKPKRNKDSLSPLFRKLLVVRPPDADIQTRLHLDPETGEGLEGILPYLHQETVSMQQLVANDLFASGFRALERGRYAEARRLFDEYLNRTDELGPGLRGPCILAKEILDCRALEGDPSPPPEEVVGQLIDRITAVA